MKLREKHTDFRDRSVNASKTKKCQPRPLGGQDLQIFS